MFCKCSERVAELEKKVAELEKGATWTVTKPFPSSDYSTYLLSYSYDRFYKDISLKDVLLSLVTAFGCTIEWAEGETTPGRVLVKKPEPPPVPTVVTVTGPTKRKK